MLNSLHSHTILYLFFHTVQITQNIATFQALVLLPSNLQLPKPSITQFTPKRLKIKFHWICIFSVNEQKVHWFFLLKTQIALIHHALPFLFQIIHHQQLPMTTFPHAETNFRSNIVLPKGRCPYARHCVHNLTARLHWKTPFPFNKYPSQKS